MMATDISGKLLLELIAPGAHGHVTGIDSCLSGRYLFLPKRARIQSNANGHFSASGQDVNVMWPSYLLDAGRPYIFRAYDVRHRSLFMACEGGMSRSLLNIAKRSVPRLTLRGVGLTSKDAVG